MIIIEIILTIFAWIKGWKWYSLIPVGAAVLIGILVGLTSSYVDIYSLWWIDFMAIIALIIMVIVPPKKKMENK
jgi:hypothetical protein